MLKKVLMALSCTVIIGGSIGCSSPKEAPYEENLQCNITSHGNMAETEDGFFYTYNGILYYMDKENMDVLVPVCNKPDCKHESLSVDNICNGRISDYDQILQRNGKLYAVGQMQGGLADTCIFEIATDGSGIAKTYEIPYVVEEDCRIDRLGNAMSQNQLMLAYQYLNQQGEYTSVLACMKENSFTVIDSFSGQLNEYFLIADANGYWKIRGDDIYIFAAPGYETKDLLRSLAYVDEDSYEFIQLPEGITNTQLVGSYISGDKFTYFIENKGFYEYDLHTGEYTLVMENQLEDSVGFMLTEDYLFESNRYKGYIDGEVYLKFYNGQKWIDVAVPDEVKYSDLAFSPRAIASDRIFFKQSKTGFNKLYYFMLDDDTPELVPCGYVGEMPEGFGEKLESQETFEEQITQDESVVVFDNEYGTFEIVGSHVEGNDYVIEVDYQFTDDTKDCRVSIQRASINGIEQPVGHYVFDSQSVKGSEDRPNIIIYEEELKASGVSEIYAFDEFTDIELDLHVTDYTNMFEVVEEVTVHYYPNGESEVIRYEREPQSSDVVLIDNENVTVTLTNYNETILPNDTAQLFIQNKTKEDIKFGIPSYSINGHMYDDGIEVDYLTEFVVGGETCTFKTLSLADQNFFKESGIKEVGNIAFLMKAYVNGENGRELAFDEFLVNEVVSLDVNQEVVSYEREAQSSDIILVDNAYVTILLAGYEDYGNESDRIENGLVNLYCVNKTDKVITLRGEDGIANGIAYGDRGGFAFNDISLLPENSFALTIKGHIGYLQLNNYTSLEDMQLTLKMMDYETAEELASEEVVLEILEP